jgi:pSer/pThr/pTyr-binding forkhead associated (FHA) protein
MRLSDTTQLRGAKGLAPGEDLTSRLERVAGGLPQYALRKRDCGEEPVALLDVQGLQGREVVMLEGERMTIGKNPDCDLEIGDDASVSRVHARLEPVGGGWSICDLGSTNGTFVNGVLIFGERILRDDDEIIVGRTRLHFCDRSRAGDASTERTGARPRLTPTERKVLIELCRPLRSGAAFTQPATPRAIAERLFVGEAAVKQHISHLQDKFGITEDEGVPKRVRLANAALETGTITFTDLKEDDDSAD